jgi:hypothetical protein
MSGSTVVMDPDVQTRQMLRQMLAEELVQQGRQPRPGTVEVDAGEWEATKARCESVKRIQGTLDLTQARMRELEALLKREQQEHARECEQMLKRIKSLGG